MPVAAPILVLPGWVRAGRRRRASFDAVRSRFARCVCTQFAGVEFGHRMTARRMTTEILPRQESAKRATIPIFDADAVTRACENALAQARVVLSRIESVPLEGVSVENVLDAWADCATALEEAFGPISLLNSVHPDSAVRDAADVALVNECSCLTDVFQNEAFYQRVQRVEPDSIAARELRKHLLEAFEDSGVSLPEEKRQRFKEISERLTELGQEFAKNVRENATRLTFTIEECRGLPQSWLDRVPRDEDGNVVVGFDYPDYVPFLMNAHDGDARRRYWMANTTRGTGRNLDVLDELLRLRKEIADLYEVPNFADYDTKRRMDENPDT